MHLLCIYTYICFFLQMSLAISDWIELKFSEYIANDPTYIYIHSYIIPGMAMQSVGTLTLVLWVHIHNGEKPDHQICLNVNPLYPFFNSTNIKSLKEGVWDVKGEGWVYILQYLCFIFMKYLSLSNLTLNHIQTDLQDKSSLLKCLLSCFLMKLTLNCDIT